MKLELDLAKTFLRGVQEKRLQSVRLRTAFGGIFLACLGLFLGGALMGGYHQTFEKAILDFNAHIIVKQTDGYLSQFQTQPLQTELTSLQAAYPLDFTPFLYWEGLVATGDGMQSVVLKGVEWPKLKTLYPFQFKEETPDALSAAPQAYIGKNLQLQNLKAKNGRFAILHLREGQLKTQSMTLAGTFQTGIEPYDSEFILLDLSVLHQQLVQDEADPVLGFEIRMHDLAQIDLLADELRRAFGDVYEIKTWDELNFSLLDGLKLEKTTFSAVGVCILLIACLNIFGFNLMFFLQNREAFAVLSHLGYANARIRKLLMGISLFVGLSASAAACLLAGLVTLYLNIGPGLILNFKDLPPVMVIAVWNWVLVGLFFVTTILVCLFSSYVASKSLLKR